MAKRTVTPQPEMDDARQAALDKALGDITKRYGDGSIMRLGEAHQMLVEAIPPGSLSLDIALGVGGIPRGRITEIYGPESSGKTTISQHIVAEAQKLGGTAAYLAMGHATIGMQARLMSQALRKLSGAIKQTNTSVIFTNQLRQKIGVMFGNPETTSGGMALKFYASVRLDVRRIEGIKQGGQTVGS